MEGYFSEKKGAKTLGYKLKIFESIGFLFSPHRLHPRHVYHCRLNHVLANQIFRNVLFEKKNYRSPNTNQFLIHQESPLLSIRNSIL